MTNQARLWELIVPYIKCDFCGKEEMGYGMDDHEFAEHLDSSGWTVRSKTEKIKCDVCNGKIK